MQAVQHLLQIVFLQPFLNLLFLIYGVIPGHDFGVSVIIITLIIRFALWPLTAKQLHGQKKMQELQPEIAKVKKKAKGDKQLESQMLMELYKEKEISPFSSCLPALLQFPFLIALYFVFRAATQNTANLVNLLYAPIQHLPAVASILQNPSSFHPSLFGVISMSNPSIPLAIIAGITQYFQVAMITPKQQGDSKDPAASATKMMNYVFPLVTVFIAWKLPAALPLYWITTNIVSIVQQKIIMREEVVEMEEVKVIKKLTAPQKKITKPKRNTKNRG
jgi:YidC/Oxa1 family membrane protein insertase